jgi:WD40 repeat protein/Flp pilus assembly protein TadD
MPSTIEIFCCYAREDQPLLEHLQKHLMLLQRQGLVSIWSDTNINAGEEWEKAVHAHLDTAHIILLLVSPDFMASDYCYSTEMQRAMQRHAQGDARVIPILLRYTLWKDAPFANLQMLPQNARPIASWLDKDEPLYAIAEQISLLVKELQMQLSLKEAEQLYSDKRHEGALVLYDQVLAQEPQNAQAYAGKAKTLLALQHYEESLAAFEQAEQIDQNIADVDFYQRKASTLYLLGRYEESLLAYDKALQICLSEANNISYHPAPGIYLKKADIFLLLKRYSEALKAYDQAIALRPGASGLYMRKGDLLFRLCNFDSALKMYKEAIHLKPLNASYHEQKGKLLLEWQRYEEALAAFEQAITLSTTPLPQYYAQKGQALLRLERYEEALTTYDQALQALKDPLPIVESDESEQALQAKKEDSSYLHSGKGLALLGLERYEEALAAFTNAIEHCAPNNIDPRFYHYQGIAYERLAQQAYEMEQQSRLLWLQKQDEEAFFISPPETQKSLLNIEKFRLLRTLRGHTGSINSLAISPNGQGLVSGSSDQTVRMWEMSTGEELRSIRGYATDVSSVAISPDGQTLITGSDVIKIYNLATGRLLDTIENRKQAFCIAISPDGQILVSGNNDGTINVWGFKALGYAFERLTTGILHLTKGLQAFRGHRGSVLSVAISPDGQILVSGSNDTTINVWKLTTAKAVSTLKGHEDSVNCVAISPDGQTIVSGSNDKTIRIWQVPINQEPGTSWKQAILTHKSSVTSVAISPDGQKIVCGCQDNTIRVWELATRKLLQILQGRTGSIGGVSCVAISPDGQTVVSGREDGNIEVWGVQ